MMRVGERRRDERRPFESHIEMQVSGEIYWLTVASRNLSQGGLSFVTAVPLSIGETICLGLRLSGEGEQLIVEARVRSVTARQNDFVVGVEFGHRLSPTQLTDLAASGAVA